MPSAAEMATRSGGRIYSRTDTRCAPAAPDVRGSRRHDPHGPMASPTGSIRVARRRRSSKATSPRNRLARSRTLVSWRGYGRIAPDPMARLMIGAALVLGGASMMTAQAPAPGAPPPRRPCPGRSAPRTFQTYCFDAMAATSTRGTSASNVSSGCRRSLPSASNWEDWNKVAEMLESGEIAAQRQGGSVSRRGGTRRDRGVDPRGAGRVRRQTRRRSRSRHGPPAHPARNTPTPCAT